LKNTIRIIAGIGGDGNHIESFAGRHGRGGPFPLLPADNWQTPVCRATNGNDEAFIHGGRKVAQTLLIIDDDEKLNRLLKKFMADFGYTVSAATHPEEGLKKIRHLSPDLVILDVMLPDMNGFEVCKKIRQFSTVPIVMLTARGELMDKVVGLELGADDYLPKPFEPRELVARIQSVLRRYQNIGQSQVQSFGRLTVDFAGRKVWVDEAPVALSTNEFAALAF